MWEHATRFVIGSANLTAAGYRRQVEVGMAIDMPGGGVSRPVLFELTSELRSIIEDLAPGDIDEPGPKRRALDIVAQAEQRITGSDLPDRARAMKFAVGVSRRGTSPLDRLDDVWQGQPRQSVTALAPFWDTSDGLPGVQALLDRLARRSATGTPTRATFVVPVEPIFGGADVVRAPVALRAANRS